MRLSSLHAQSNSRRSGGLEVVCSYASLSSVLSFLSRCPHTVITSLYLHLKSQNKQCFLLSSIVQLKSFHGTFVFLLYSAATAIVYF
jgi:hypothetical protein